MSDSITMNRTVTRIGNILDARGEPPWSETIIDDGRNKVTLIASGPGHSNDAHVHPDFNEWWLVMKGELEWQVGDYPAIKAKVGDIVMSPAGTRHLITTVSGHTSLRLAVSKYDSNHDVKGERGPLTAFPPETSPPNLVHTKLDDIMSSHGPAPWSQETILDVNNRAHLVCAPVGQTPDEHTHLDGDQWFAVLRGELDWDVAGHETERTRVGDILYVPAGTAHKLTPRGSEDTLRLSNTASQGFRTLEADGSIRALDFDLSKIPGSLA
ncbi:MAG: cupin domain-containing protein [Chloroflexi bacterium]|nr:cupin domain-containing protein [Chloroflexota bacterium]